MKTILFIPVLMLLKMLPKNLEYQILSGMIYIHIFGPAGIENLTNFQFYEGKNAFTNS